MVCCLYGDDVSEEVRPQEQTDGLDDVSPLGLIPRQGQHCKLLVWSQHHHLWAKHHPDRK